MQLIIQSRASGGYSDELVAWRARIIGYDRTDVVSASILGPYFDAEENPAGGRPLFLADGRFRGRMEHSFSLPSQEASIFIRLFRQRRVPSTWWRDSYVADDEFLAMHLYFELPETTGGEEKESGRRARTEPGCSASFWKVHNPVRNIVHCNLGPPANEKRIAIDLQQQRQDVPRVYLNGQAVFPEQAKGSSNGP